MDATSSTIEIGMSIGVCPRTLVVGLPFRDLPEKGWEVTEAVIDRLREQGPPLRITAWGPGAPGRLRHRYDEVHEPASDDELIRIYDSCDVLLYTSWHDGFPLPPIQAMARGVAAVLTRSGGVTDYADDGRNCLMAAPGDVESLTTSVLRLARDPSLRARLVEQGAETARRFSRERFTTRRSSS
jgi:glycosyltransferase involved in cell wall biosynthesis